MVKTKVFSMRSSMSADLPVKYCVNSMAKENSARERAVFPKLHILRKATGIIFFQRERSFHMELLIDHVSKQFKDKTAVNDISLELTPGVWGLLGANGAGKTTLTPCPPPT